MGIYNFIIEGNRVYKGVGSVRGRGYRGSEVFIYITKRLDVESESMCGSDFGSVLKEVTTFLVTIVNG